MTAHGPKRDGSTRYENPIGQFVAKPDVGLARDIQKACAIPRQFVALEVFDGSDESGEHLIVRIGHYSKNLMQAPAASEIFMVAGRLPHRLNVPCRSN